MCVGILLNISRFTKEGDNWSQIPGLRYLFSLIFRCFFKHKHLFDFSNFSKDSKVFDPANKKVIGKMKDTSEGKINDEFDGLKSKMYSMKYIDGKESNKAKGVNIATEFNEFKDTLFNKKSVRHKMRRI